MEALKQALNISKTQETFTKVLKKPKNYNSVKDNVLMKENFNFMADLLFLPTTKEGFKYLLVVVDLASDEFDIEPLKTKDSAEVVKAIETMKKRKYVQLKNNSGQSVRTDSGTEFKGTFAKYLYKHSILHKIAQPNRHIQLANVERLNGTLGTLFNGYMNSKEKETSKVYREWTDKINIIRDQLNEIRKKKLPDDIFEYVYPTWNAEEETKSKKLKIIEPKFKVGDLVYVGLESPENALGKKVNGGFRNGDYRLTKEPHRILQLLYYHGPPYYRYIVNKFEGVSYQEDELRLAEGKTEETFKVKKIIGKKTIKGEIYYKIWWKGELRNQATFEPKSNLIMDIPLLIDLYEKNLKT